MVISERYLVLRMVIMLTLSITNNGQLHNFTTSQVKSVGKFDNALQSSFKNLQHKQTTPKNVGISPQLIQNFITLKFKSEIVRLFEFLPQEKRCNILEDLSNSTNCSNGFISKTLHKNHIIKDYNIIGCVQDTILYCHGQNITERVLQGFWNRMVDLLNDLPVPFQCTILNKVSTSLTSSVKKHRHKRSSFLNEGKTLRISLEMVETQLQKVYPSLNVTQRCSKVWKPLKKKVPLESPASLVNLTIQLGPGTRRKAWVKRLRRKAYRIYTIYHKFNAKDTRNANLLFIDRIYSPKPVLLPKKDVRIIVIRMSKISHLVVNVVFALEVKKSRSAHFTKVKPAKQIIKALNASGSATMTRVFGGNVLALIGAKRDNTKTDSFWTAQDMANAQSQFPSYLLSYFRLGMDRLGRCLVMIYISTSFERDLRPVEMLYNSMKYLPRKYFCSSTRRNTAVTDISLNLLYRANDTDKNFKTPQRSKEEKFKNGRKDGILLIDRINDHENSNVTFPDNEPTKFYEYDQEEIEEPVEDTRKVSALEIGLFALLGMLCLAILAFATYCIIFAFKRKSAQPTDEEPPKSAFALFRKVDETQNTNNTEIHRERDRSIRLKPITSLRGSSCSTNGKFPADTADDIQNSHPQQLQCNIKENVYTRDPWLKQNPNSNPKRIPRNQKEHSKPINNKDLQITGESDDDVFYEQTPQGVNKCEVENAISDCSLGEISTQNKQRTLKESCGEMKLVSDSDSSSLGREHDPVIKNNNMQVVVVFDEQRQRESSM